MSSHTCAKVAIIGAGQVGSTTAYTLLLSNLVAEVVLIDVDKRKVEGQFMDLNHAAPLTKESRFSAGDYESCAGAAVVIVTGGANQKPGQTRMELAARNVKIMQEIIPKIVKYAPNAILLIATNPVDVLTYASYKLSGFPASKVIGSGTVLDSARLQHNLSKHFNLSSESVNAFIIGEHGDSGVPVWSLAEIASMKVEDYCKQSKREFDPKILIGMYEETRDAAAYIIERKGYTNFGIAAGLARIVRAILRDEGALLTVSTVNEHYGMKDLSLSVPTRVDRNGAQHVVDLLLDDKELKLIKESGHKIKSACDELGI